MERPYVVTHLAVSLDGATTGFEVDLGRFYGLVGTWDEDVTLTGADTILAQEAALRAERGPGPAPDGALLAVVDGRGRVSAWEELRQSGYWRDVLAVFTESTPPRPDGFGVEEFVAGSGRVDLAAVLAELTERGADTVRVDSGGRLVSALLDRGLLDEVSLLVHPVLVGEGSERRWFASDAARQRLQRLDCTTFDDGVVWLRYRVVG